MVTKHVSAEVKAKLIAVDEVGEDEIFQRVADGMDKLTLIKSLGIGYKLFDKWLDLRAGRRQAYEQARHEASHFYAHRALETAQKSEASTAAADRLRVDTDKWYAAKLNAEYDTRQRDVAISVSISDLHAQAAQLLASVNGDVIDGEAIEVDDGDDDER